MRNIHRILVASFLLVSFDACTKGGEGGDSGSGGECSALSLRIFGGQTCDPNGRSPVVGLVSLTESGGQFTPASICTGALVTLDDFVTSAHCFVAPIAEFGDQIVGFAAVVGGENGEAMEVVDVQIHPLYDGTPGSPFDVAMATIERVPNPPIGPLPLLTSVQTRVGDDVTTFGYGTSNRGEIGILKAANLSIDEIEDGNLVVVNSKPGDSICQGDSGGPLVKSVNGVTGLIGINSFGDATQDECADSGARIAGFVDIQNPATRSFILSYAADIGQS